MLSLKTAKIYSLKSASGLTLNTTKTNGLIYSRAKFGEINCIESFFQDVHFKRSLRFLGVILDDNLGWRSHMDLVVKRCSQRLYILRRLKSVTSIEEYFLIYCGIVRTLLEYACPAFVGLSSLDASRLEKIQRRCLRIKGICDVPDLSSRRRSMATSLFVKLRSVDTFLKHLLPNLLPSGRPDIPFCRTSLRRSSFIPAMSIGASNVYID